MNEVIRAYFPYCIRKTRRGWFQILSREHSQTSLSSEKDLSKEEDQYEIDLEITPDIATRLSWDGDSCTDVIYLYRDGYCRADVPDHLHAYLNRLALLAQLRLQRDPKIEGK